MIGMAHESTAQTALTVDELCALARSLGESNAQSERHLLASLRLPAPEMSADALDRVRRDAHVAGLDCYLDRGWLVLEPDAAALAEQEFFELQAQLHEARAQIAGLPWLRRLRDESAACRDRLLQLARGA